jgi:hypothetical protein
MIRWLKMPILIYLALLLFSFLNSPAGAATSLNPAAARPAARFYLDCSAPTSGTGTQASPWNSLASPNAFTFIPGAQILIQRGTTCNGTLAPHGSGSATAPIVIDAYGTGAQPIINGGNAEEAVKLFNQQYWEINNLEITGGNLYGVYISGNTPNQSLNHIYLKNLNVHGANFTSTKRSDSGEVFVDSKGVGEVLNDVLIDGVIAHDSHVSQGIAVSAGGAWTGTRGAPQTLGNNITVQNSTAHDVYGDGIIITETTNGLLQNNVVYRSGLCPTCTGSTPVGLWEWYCHTCTVQNNESYANQSWGGDGGDFDIDYYNNNNVVQYNYGHDSAGYCVAFFGADATPSLDNIFRYNVCSNNGRRSDLSKDGEVYVYTWDNGSLNGVQIYNNTFYWNPATNAAALITSDATFSGNSPLSFKNNIIYATVPAMVQTTSAFTLDNNIYWTTSASPATWQVGNTTYTSFSAYQTGSHQDLHSYQSDPLLNDPSYHAVGKPTNAFHLLRNSPAIAKGADVCTAIPACSMGTLDFWGNPLPHGTGYNIGAYQGPNQSQPQVLNTSTNNNKKIRGPSFRVRSQPREPILLAFLQTVPDTADTSSRQEVAFLLSMKHQYSAQGLKVAIVDASALVSHQPPTHKDLLNAAYDWHLDIPLLEDRNNRIATRLAVAQLPAIILIAPDGTISQRWQGFTNPAILAQAIDQQLRHPLNHPPTPPQ